MPIATADDVESECKRLQVCFPQISLGFIIGLAQRLKDNKWSRDQIRDAMNHVIDTCKFPIPLVADILSWDIKVKLYTHKEVVDGIASGYTFDDYEMVKIKDQTRWIRK